MSATVSLADVKPPPAQYSPQAYSTRPGPEHNPHAILDSSLANTHQASNTYHNLDTTHFSFLQHGLQEEPSLASFLADHDPDPFSNTSLPAPAPPITSPHIPGFGGTASSRGRSSMESEEDSPSVQPLGSSLDESLPLESDEFGVSSGGPEDGTDLGGRPKEDMSKATPAWSELKTKAGKERKRLPLACVQCRKKKIRCSGEKPHCKHCSRSNQPCLYKTTPRKAAPRTEYMTMLDKRLKRMEDRIIKIVPKSEQDSISSSVPRANVKPVMPGTLSSGKRGPRKRGAEEAFGGAELDGWAKTSTKTMVGSPPQLHPVSMVSEIEESKLHLEGAEALPPRDIQEHLANVFFDHVHGQAYHLLHKPSYMKKLGAGELPPVLVLSVCAMSARFSTHPRVAKTDTPAFLRGEEWASVARDIVTRRYEWPSLTLLTCLLILGLNEFATCQGQRSWSFGGQALRMAVALQLHNDLDQDPSRPGEPLSFVDREIRRRTMWACFLMDRFNSSGRERIMFVNEEAIQIPLPVKENNFKYDMPALTQNLQGEVPGALISDEAAKADAQANMGVAAYMIKVVSLWGRAIHHLNQGGKAADEKLMWDDDSEYMSLVKEAEELATSLPESLVYNKDNLHLHHTEQMANQFLFLHVAIQQNILFLNRFAASRQEDTEPTPESRAFIAMAGKKAFDAANRISDILGDSEHVLITAPFVGYCAYLSGTLHVSGAFSSSETIQKSSKENLGVNIRFLQKHQQFWGLYPFLIEDLRRQYGKISPKNGNQPNSSAIFQYGDWYGRYPHGVSQSDFMDPAIYKKKEKGEDAVMEQKADLQTVEEYRKEEYTKLSPRSRDANGRAGSGSVKRRPNHRGSITSRNGGDHHGANNHHQLEPLSTSFATPNPMARSQHQPFPNVTTGPMTSSPANFTGLDAFNTPMFNHTAPSPISPGGVGNGHFGTVHGQHPKFATHDLFNADMMPLHEPMLTNAHSMMGSYSAGAIMPNVTAIDGPHNNPHHTVFGHGHDANSASWQMPFSFEDVIGDVNAMSNGMGFSNLFPNGTGGMNGNGGP